MKPIVKSGLVARDFPGLVTNADSGDIPFGAATVQDNIQSITPGRLTVRRGWQRAENFNRPDVGTIVRSDLTCIYRYRHTSGDRIITVTANGEIQSRINNTVTDIKTGELGTVAWAFARDRCGALLGVNGFGRGVYWDGVATTAGKLGLDAPTAAPAVALGAVGAWTGAESIGTYKCYYRYVAGPSGRYHYSNLSPATDVVVAAPDLGKAFSWNTLPASSQPRVHGVECWRSLPGDENTLYLVNTISVSFGGLIFAAGPGGLLKITTQQLNGFALNDYVTVAGSGGDDGTSQIVGVVNGYTFITSALWSTLPAGSATVSGSGVNDKLGDTELQDAAIADPSRLLLLTSNGEIIANRFVPPPEWKAVMAKFQDRMFYAVDAVVTQGSMTTTGGDTAVVINGLAVDALWVWDNRIIYIPGEAKPLIIQSVLSPTQFYVDPPPSNAALQSGYIIRPPECERNTLYYSEPDEEQSVPRTNVITIQEQAEDEDEIVGLHTFGAYLYVLKEHHIYTVSFIRQPRIDAQARLLVHRGAFNHRCWDTYEGVAYLMDSSGCYVLGSNGAFDSISEPIQDMWRDGIIDITDTQWFFVRVDTKHSVVRFYVRFVGDYGTRPRRALCYNIRTGAWGTESYPLEVSAATSIDVGGDRFNLGASQNDIVVDFAGAEADMVASEIRGQLDVATAETIGDLEANFTDQHIGAPIAIVDGNGRGQVRTIVEIVSSTVIRVDTIASPIVNFDQAPLDPIPDPGSTYIIGGINYRYRTGQYDLVESDNQNRRASIVEFTPTIGEYFLLLRRFWDQEDEPEINWHSQKLGDGVFTIQGTPDSYIELTRARTSRGTNPGRNRVQFSGKTEIPSQGHWSVAIELEGIKGDEPIYINGVTVEGVED